MKINVYIFVSLLFIMASCHGGFQKSSELNVNSQPVITKSESAWHYFRYGESEPFAKEFGKVVKTQNGDTLKLEFCRDSLHNYHFSGETMRSNRHFCLEHKGKFIGGRYEADTTLERITNKGRDGNPIHIYSRMRVKGITRLDVGRDTLEVIKLVILQSEDMAGKKVIYHGVEYWNRDLGQVLRVDENFRIKRRRLVRLAESTAPQGAYLPALLEHIQQDSSDWVTKMPDGKPWFPNTPAPKATNPTPARQGKQIDKHK